MNQIVRIGCRCSSSWIIAAVSLLSIALEAQAWQTRQPAGGREERRGGPSGRLAPGGGGSESASQGMYRGYIVRYAPAQDSESEDLLGYLSVKSEDKGTKTLKVRVLRREGLVIQLADNKLDLETAPDVLLKGLYCTVNWAYEPTEGKKKPTVKQLTGIVLDAFDVAGTVDTMGDDLVILKARPISGDWPGVSSEQGPGGSRGSTARLPLQKKLKLRTLENVTKYRTAEMLKPGDPGDFEPGQDIEATVVFGRSKDGMLLDLRPPGLGDPTKFQPPTPGGGRPPVRPPTPPSGGRRPRGGG